MIGMLVTLLSRTTLISLLVLGFAGAAWAQETIWLDAMDISLMRQGYGTPQTNRSVDQAPISLGVNSAAARARGNIASRKFERGVGTHARSTFWIEPRGAQSFSAIVGVNDTCGGPGSVVFSVMGDGKKLFDSGVMNPGIHREVSVNVAGIKKLLLMVNDAGDGINYDHAVWADARFTYTGTPPRAIPMPVDRTEILTPRPKQSPRINGPTIYGCRPGNPFLYRIPAQGERPMHFSARELPPGLSLDAATGIIQGRAPDRGTYSVTLRASNSHGTSTRIFRIVAGDTLALTPPMGWNHWYAHYDRITDKMMREAADLLISSGMADVGYDYVNIDDCWMNAPKHADPMRVGPLRDEQGRMVPNRHFPDMKGLADYIHSKGLKAGLYTSPGPLTCGGFAGSFQHEEIDAATFAEWGYDFLKYDWCSYRRVADGTAPGSENTPNFSKPNADTREIHKHPFQLMGDLLKRQGRDMVYNLCQYGMQNVWEWGEEVGGHSWRTAGDLGYALNQIFEVALKNANHRAWSRPGAWNDPDYIQIGWIGNARGGGLPAPTTMRPNEQYAYMSLWALMASPIFYSGDMTKLDEFTLNVLCNPEVIDINQDALGQSAAIASLGPDAFLMVKDLEDGSRAIGLFNLGEFEAELNLPWSVAGLRGARILRDVWRHTDLGRYNSDQKFTVPARGGLLLTAREDR
jgi:alpha-galactosidase